MYNIKDKVVLITGASGDIGRACAIQLSYEGVKLILHTGSNIERLNETITLCKGGSVVDQIICDGRDLITIEDFFLKLKASGLKLDGLVNNAGDLLDRKTLEEMNWNFFLETFEVNMMPTFLFTKNAVELMNNPASIVMISSMTARGGKGNKSSAYGMVKSAMLGWTKSLANELGPKGICVNAIAPGFIEGRFHEKHTTASVTKEHAASNPMKRNGVPNDIANTVLFYIANAGGYTNGTTLDVNGGAYMC